LRYGNVSGVLKMAGGREFAGVAGGNVVACFLFDIGFDEERRDVLTGVAGLSAGRDAKEKAEQKKDTRGRVLRDG
jgi:hypothetical protein